MFKQINHIILMVSDMNKSVEFYQSQLGFTAKFRSDNWTELDAGNITLALHGGGKSATQKPKEEPHNPHAGLASISFDVEDIENVFSELSSRGVPFSLKPTPRPQEGIVLAVAQDPDGFDICFAQRLS